jgi:unconventional prefoldin RPB5 interactor 1
MAAPIRDSFPNIEKQRLELEENIARLQKALEHWQQWDAEYESLKEQIEELPTPVAQKDLRRLKRDYVSDVIEKKELSEIFGRIDLKPAEQILNVLNRRIDYVTTNIATLEKQLEIAEKKYAAATLVPQPEAINEDGLPITEIIEELDDDDNVTSYRLQTPGDAEPRVLEVLEKAAGKGRADGDHPSKIRKPLGKEPSSALDLQRPPQETTAPETRTAVHPQPAKKGVSFAEDTKAGHEPQTQLQKSRDAQRVQKIMQAAKNQEKIMTGAPIIPTDELAREAALRREMLNYGMSEVGAVVAELTLDESESDEDLEFDEDFKEEYSDVSGSEDVDDDDNGKDDDHQDGEDDYDDDGLGRSRTSPFTPEYFKRMMALERRLGIQPLTRNELGHMPELGGRLAAEPSEPPEDPVEDSSDEGGKGQKEGLARVTVKANAAKSLASETTRPKSALKSTSNSSKPTDDSETKKMVAFAASLGIAPSEHQSVPATSIEGLPTTPKVEAYGDVVERTGESSTGSSKNTESRPRKKPSRFKKHITTSEPVSPGTIASEATLRQSNIPKGPGDVPTRFLDDDEKRPPVPIGPKGKLATDTVVEREVSVAPQDMEEDDGGHTGKEIAEEFHRQRSNFIHRRGGFVEQETDTIQPLDEGTLGGRVSKFKAARLSKE